FGVTFPELDGVEPLFTPDDYCIYDQYSDGDPFEDAEYIRQFRVILTAIRQNAQIKFEMTNRKGNTTYVRCRPIRLEYSEKDDKFRVITTGCRFVTTANLARIRACTLYSGDRPLGGTEREARYDTVTVRLADERNALERFMLHFAHFEKQAERIDETNYLIRIRYVSDDALEMVIRILSFGRMVEVTEPEAFRNLVIEKLKKQKKCGLK
ncbi:MAG: WYL domain-containing protein, partial [Clostridia bacterium]|nr:WYL domain-containing protein [Clostridia bacterium]